MLSIVVLGTAAGGGVPQWNCGCANCRAARNGRPELQSTQASIAVSADREHWFLVNASPDLRQQITETPALHPRTGHLRQSPIAGVILTNGEVDAVAGRVVEVRRRIGEDGGDPGEPDDQQHRLGTLCDRVGVVLAQRHEHRPWPLEHEQRAKPPVAHARTITRL